MAARTRRPFYVYAIGDIDAPAYIGKGSGSRLATQIRKHNLPGVEIARFSREEDAYSFEREKIAELQPPRNKTAGGDGGRYGVSRGVREPTQEELARTLLLWFPPEYLIDTVSDIRELKALEERAFGPGGYWKSKVEACRCAA